MKPHERRQAGAYPYYKLAAWDERLQTFRDGKDSHETLEVGSLPIRAGKQFTASRKLGKTHQNVLVFVKGDPRDAADACGQLEDA